MKRKLSLLILLTIVLISNGFPQSSTTIKEEVNSWLNNPLFEHASIGVYMMNPETGKVLAETKPQLSLVPASTLKLLTTSTALEMLGSDFHFETKLAYNGQIRNDTLIGNLVIIGGGDPALGSKYFKEHYQGFLDGWVQKTKDLHIKYITGDIMTDATIFEEQMIPDTWIWEDLGNYYGAGACGLSVYDNLYKIHFSSPQKADQQTKVESTEPFIPKLVLKNEVESSDINRDQAYVFGAPTDNTRTIRGTIPKGKSDFVVKASIPNPPYLLAWNLKSKLRDAGITVEGSIQNIKQKNAPLNFHPITSTYSPRLIDILRITNYESVNLFAEHMLKYLSYLMVGKGSTKEGVKVVTDFWQKRGIDMKGLFMADGSGLSRFNSITAKEMVEVLDYMKIKSPEGEAFFSTIPFVPNGTLYFFNPMNFPSNSLQAKSGSMTRVRCYAGQLVTKSGQKVLFAILLNNFSCTQGQAIHLVEDLLVRVSKS